MGLSVSSGLSVPSGSVPSESSGSSGGISRAGFLRLAGGMAAGLAVPGLLAACGSGSSGALKVVGVADEKPPLDLLTAAYHKKHPDVSFKTSYAPTDQVETSLRA